MLLVSCYSANIDITVWQEPKIARTHSTVTALLHWLRLLSLQKNVLECVNMKFRGFLLHCCTEKGKDIKPSINKFSLKRITTWISWMRCEFPLNRIKSSHSITVNLHTINPVCWLASNRWHHWKHIEFKAGVILDVSVIRIFTTTSAHFTIVHLPFVNLSNRKMSKFQFPTFSSMHYKRGKSRTQN